MPENKMMKGFHGMVNMELIEFIDTALTEIADVWDDDTAEEKPDDIIRLLMERHQWTFMKDNFGTKAYKSTTYPASTPPLSTDEFRITLVNPKGTRNGALHIDIRPWGSY